MKSCPRLCHQGKIRRACIIIFRKMVCRLCWAVVVQFRIEHLKVFSCIGANLCIGIVRTAFISQRSKGDILQSVARCTNFCINFQTALKLVLVICPKRAFEGKGEIFYMLIASACGQNSACVKAKAATVPRVIFLNMIFRSSVLFRRCRVGFTVMRVEIFFDGLGLLQWFLDHA